MEGLTQVPQRQDSTAPLHSLQGKRGTGLQDAVPPPAAKPWDSLLLCCDLL